MSDEAADAVEGGVGEDVRGVDRQERVENVEDGSETTITTTSTSTSIVAFSNGHRR